MEEELDARTQAASSGLLCRIANAPSTASINVVSTLYVASSPSAKVSAVLTVERRKHTLWMKVSRPVSRLMRRASQCEAIPNEEPANDAARKLYQLLRTQQKGNSRSAPHYSDKDFKLVQVALALIIASLPRPASKSKLPTLIQTRLF
ncbi:unnamed protein product [Phytophthora lilii]|uniref:Unnamed protein product n=1 Tax=Phytophthora lilii TaxID=2077276 RepID=A0A9W6TEG4_9STRA|nr:unnamed protein product [Phytophthora lilii]